MPARLCLACIFLGTLVLQLCYGQKQGLVSNVDLNVQRFEYKYSFKPPFYMVRSASIPFWDFGGSALVNEEYVRLTPSIMGRYGWIWNKRPSLMEAWEIVVTFRIHGDPDVGADGMAIWYTKESRRDGNTFGNQDGFVGLGIFIDTYDNDGKHDSPSITAIINDGTKKYSVETDGLGQGIGRCLSYVRNSHNPMKIKVRYMDRVLSVDISKENPTTVWDNCFEAPDVDLPTGYYFGVTAITGDHADKQDIVSFQATDLRPKSFNEMLSTLRTQQMEPVALHPPIPSSSILSETRSEKNDLSQKQDESTTAGTNTPSMLDSKPKTENPKTAGIETPSTEQAGVVCSTQEIESLRSSILYQFEVVDKQIKDQNKLVDDVHKGLTKEVELIRKQNELMAGIVKMQNDKLNELNRALGNLEKVLSGHKEHVSGALIDQGKSAEIMKTALVDLSRMVSQLQEIVSNVGYKHETLVRDVASDLRQNVNSGSSTIMISLYAVFGVLAGLFIYAWKTQKIQLPSMV
eukprot:TRINITY_DN6191_c0_g1_i1.p1 TRINITY_DN6191_c0_g1~~TRINITY_DN6191_c0_g1_i1.p1  ORF type:complete len:518 (-),score=121.69 TRINITY_DN6191_c0_g1_i1:48-1601(-)